MIYSVLSNFRGWIRICVTLFMCIYLFAIVGIFEHENEFDESGESIV